ncbi:MAG: hypothetical protein HY580_08615, partial [Nitrospinae bacterium]|nr:hypothetical protein [Nitrospinota bacterium]
MIDRDEPPDKELQLRIKTIMVLRALFLAGFVILIFLFQKDVSYHAPVGPLSAAIGAAFFLSM